MIGRPRHSDRDSPALAGAQDHSESIRDSTRSTSGRLSPSPASSMKAMSDVKLPSIRSLGGFQDHHRLASPHLLPPMGSAPPLKPASASSTSSSSPASSAPASAAIAAATLAPPSSAPTASSAPSPITHPPRLSSLGRHFTEPRQPPCAIYSQPQPDSQSAVTAHDSLRSSESLERRPFSAMGPPRPAQQRSYSSATTNAAAGATSYHPFFDAGRKDSATAGGEALKARWKAALFNAVHHLSLANGKIEEALDYHDGSDQASIEVVRDAKAYAGRAWQTLGSILDHADDVPVEDARPAPGPSFITSSDHDGHPSSRPAQEVGGSSLLSRSEHALIDTQESQQGAQRPPRLSDDPASARTLGHRPPIGSIWGLNKAASSSSSASASAERTVSAKLAYPAQDPQANDGRPRPPQAIYRTGEASRLSSFPHSQSTPPHGSFDGADEPEVERSYMYAPASIRDRLAALHRGPRRQSPNAAPAYPAPGGSCRASDQEPLPGDVHASHWAEPTSHSFVPPSFARPRVHDGSHEAYDAHAYPYGLHDDDRYGGGDGSGGNSKYKKRSRAPAPAACKNCGTNETPEWRRGPDGARTLCNACGLHFAKMVKKKGTYGECPGSDEQHHYSTSSAAALATTGPVASAASHHLDAR